MVVRSKNKNTKLVKLIYCLLFLRLCANTDVIIYHLFFHSLYSRSCTLIFFFALRKRHMNSHLKYSRSRSSCLVWPLYFQILHNSVTPFFWDTKSQEKRNEYHLMTAQITQDRKALSSFQSDIFYLKCTNEPFLFDVWFINNIAQHMMNAWKRKYQTS